MVSFASPKENQVAFTIVELLVVILVFVIFGVLIFSYKMRCTKVTTEGQYSLCQNNLRHIFMGLQEYTNQLGGMDFFPKPAVRISGADFILAPYFNGLVSDPRLYICPATTDTNNNGADLVNANVAVNSMNSVDGNLASKRRIWVSYGGYDLSTIPNGILTRKASSKTSLACDDEENEGGASIIGFPAPYNHQNGYNVLFGDGHVKWILDPDANKERKWNQMMVGNKTPLDVLKN